MKNIRIKVFVLLTTLFSLFFRADARAADCVVHTVVPGDNIWQISQNYQVDFWTVLSYNTHFSNPDLIYPGDHVYVPVNTIDYEPVEPPVPVPQPDETPSQPDVTPPVIPETPAGESSNENNNNNGSNNHSEIAQEILVLVNAERAKEGLAALTLNAEVSNVAAIKSQDMIDNKYFDHNSPVYGSPFDMLTSFGISYRAAGENIAYGQTSAAEVMNNWMNSPGHRANILDSGFTQLGVGYATTVNGTPYWTQMFITP